LKNNTNPRIKGFHVSAIGTQLQVQPLYPHFIAILYNIKDHEATVTAGVVKLLSLRF